MKVYRRSILEVELEAALRATNKAFKYNISTEYSTSTEHYVVKLTPLDDNKVGAVLTRGAHRPCPHVIQCFINELPKHTRVVISRWGLTCNLTLPGGSKLPTNPYLEECTCG